MHTVLELFHLRHPRIVTYLPHLPYLLMQPWCGLFYYQIFWYSEIMKRLSVLGLAKLRNVVSYLLEINTKVIYVFLNHYFPETFQQQFCLTADFWLRAGF